jgi:predicted ATP-dependent protease
MTNLDKQAKLLAKRLASEGPSEESIEQYHAKTPEQLEQVVPGDLEQAYIIAPDGREMLIADYIAEYGTTQKKTDDARSKILQRMKRGIAKVYVHRR